jgi:hypothetical protein
VIEIPEPPSNRPSRLVASRPSVQKKAQPVRAPDTSDSSDVEETPAPPARRLATTRPSATTKATTAHAPAAILKQPKGKGPARLFTEFLTRHGLEGHRASLVDAGITSIATLLSLSTAEHREGR